MAGDTGLHSNIFEDKIPFVKIQLVTPLSVSGEIEIWPSIIVDVASRYSCTIVIIDIAEYSKPRPFRQPVDKVDLRIGGGQAYHHRFFAMRGVTGRTQHRQQQNSTPHARQC